MAWSIDASPLPVGSTKRQERRVSARQPLSPEASYVLLTAEGSQPFAGKVRDISQEGIGLTLSCQYEPGTLMSVGLTNKTGLFGRTLALRTARIVPQDDGTFIIGGTFVTKLTGDELRALLQ